MKCYPFLPERIKALFGEGVLDPLSYNKAAITVFYQNMCTIMDALEICKFVSGWGYQEIYLKEGADLFFAATGIEVDVKALELTAERIHGLERAFAIRDGMTRKDDRICGKITREPIICSCFKLPHLLAL